MKRVLIVLLIVLAAFPCNAQTRLSVHGAGKLYPIAIPQLCVRSGESDAAKDIPKVIARNLELSGYFDVLNQNAYIEAPGKCGGPDDFAYSDWSVIGVEGLVRGVIDASGEKLKIQLYLHDVQIRRVVLGKEYSGDPDQVRRIAHRFSNEIIKFFTGEQGVFGSQIVFSSKVGRFKELFVMDMDGSNMRQLTNDRGLALSASWHPAGDRIIYTSYRDRVPELYVVNLESRGLQRITRSRSLELGAKFSKDGSTILASRSSGRASDVLLMDTKGNMLRRLTGNNAAIDVSPDWSPDNSKIVFCSNRSGGPQIYTMNADGRNVRRVSYVSSSYCTSPSWSPKGDKIAFVCRARGNQLFVVNADGSNPLQLTSYGNNEDPSWAPDGRYVVFATTFGKGRVFNLALIRSDGSGMKQLTSGRTGDTDPAWGPVPR